MTLNLCSHPSLLPPSACLFDLFLHTAFKVISTVSPWMPQCYKSKENRPVILVNNAWDQLSLKTKEFWRRPSYAYGWGGDQSTNLLGLSWAASRILQRYTNSYEHARTHLSKQNEGTQKQYHFLILGCLMLYLSLIRRFLHKTGCRAEVYPYVKNVIKRNSKKSCCNI